MQRVKSIVEIGIKMNRQDSRFVIWGTCLGFESLLFSLSNYKLQTFKVKTKNQSIPISWDPVGFPGSAFQEVLGKNVAEVMTSSPITYFTHNFGFDKSDFEKIDELKDVRVVAYYNKEGRKVVAAIQHKFLPIYAVQFHPEKILYESHNIVKKHLTRESSEAAQELSRIIFNEALENKNRFTNQHELHKFKFTKYVRHRSNSVFESIFLFKKRHFYLPKRKNHPPVCVPGPLGVEPSSSQSHALKNHPIAK